MKKKILILLVLTLALFTACGKKELSDTFDEDTVIEETKKAIDYFNSQDFEALIDMGDENLKTAIDEAQFKEAYDQIIAEIGTFKELKGYEIQSAKKDGEEFVVVQYKAEHEAKEIDYIVTFNSNMELAGFLVK
ncbi:MAG: DUF3887 domain-containing protein [Tissierellia bacterium]|nr:DUF3887 domain-containing protein [Tissierellia bacterium]